MFYLTATKILPAENILINIPGFPVSQFKIQITDIYGQIVKGDSTSIIQVYSVEAQLAGKTRFQANQGVFDIQDIIIKAKPGNSVHVKLESNGIEQNNLFYDQNMTNTMQIELTIQPCLQEQILIDGNLCQNCFYGQYSLNKNDQSCQECMQGAKCYGGNLIAPEQGY